MASKPVLSKNSDLSQVSSTSEGDKVSLQAQTKKLPPIKAPVGLARSPDLKNCKSKIGSLNNIKHTPTGGGVKIETQKLNWNAKSKVGSLENKAHKPAGGNIKVETRKLEWKTTSKVQSLQNIGHKAGGGNVKIFNELYRDKSVKAGVVCDSNTKSPDGNNSPDSSLEAKSAMTKNSTAEALSRDLKNVKLNK